MSGFGGGEYLGEKKDEIGKHRELYRTEKV